MGFGVDAVCACAPNDAAKLATSSEDSVEAGRPEARRASTTGLARWREGKIIVLSGH
jgi:hypothetical protein